VLKATFSNRSDFPTELLPGKKKKKGELVEGETRKVRLG
jgi:hypothetical protein